MSLSDFEYASNQIRTLPRRDGAGGVLEWPAGAYQAGGGLELGL